MSHPKVKFSIDRGGTFTDIYAEFADGRTQVLKLLSEDPANYADAPREGIRRILEQEQGTPLPAAQLSAANITSIRMGTTVATNALLERNGARTLLLITRGFKDLLLIGNQTRPDIFALNIQRPAPLYHQVIEVDERLRPAQPEDGATVTGSNGRAYVVEQAPQLSALDAPLRQALAAGCTSVAVVLAHAYAYPEHELQLGALIRKVGFSHCSLSHQVMPTLRMVPRGATTVVNAYLTPHIQNYIDSFCAGFADKLQTTELLFMTSGGGLVPASAFNGSRALLSGPAGGVVGYAQTCAQALPERAVIGFDMGGTSTDVSRYAGSYEHTQEGVVAGVWLQTPQLHINTVAAGGGSRLFFRHGMFEVGPESSGSHPGPVCYGKNGYLSVTDANLVLGRLQPDFFPHIFGPNEDQPLDSAATLKAFTALTAEINSWLVTHERAALTLEEVAAGFIDVANEVMARPIRAVSMQRGYDLASHVLACFGGAGGQHACAMAQKLGMETIFIHRHAGILSAYGMGLACRVSEQQEAASGELTAQRLAQCNRRLDALVAQACADLGCAASANLEIERYLHLRYSGTDNSLMISCPVDGDYRAAFSAAYRREFGFELTTSVEVDDVRVRVSLVPLAPPLPLLPFLPTAIDPAPVTDNAAAPSAEVRCYLGGAWQQVPVYRLELLPCGSQIIGPALIIQQTATIVVEAQCQGRINESGDVLISVDHARAECSAAFDPIQLALFRQRFMSIAEQMGHTLQRTAISTNIKERCDFSCALFDADGALVANAPHTPVHLGAMSEAVRQQIKLFDSDLEPGDVLVGNHPQLGGSHLPDITVVTPVWLAGQVVLYVANRGHHADIGGITPGSMPPFSRTLSEEGCAIRGMKLVRRGQFQQQQLEEILSRPGVDNQGRIIPGSRRLADNISDLQAQVAANQCGVRLLGELIAEQGLSAVHAYMGFLQDHAESAVRHGVQQLVQQLLDSGAARQNGTQVSVRAEDYLDDGTAIVLNLSVHEDGRACFDFSGSGAQQWGNLNAPPAVTMSAILYCLRCLVHEEIPLNQGCLRAVEVVLPAGSILSPYPDAAVVGGNVLTSQRVVDVILKAFGIVAASQGCMNNFTFGNEQFGYYETIGGGSGAGPSWHGCSGVHSHMTNTRITDVEIVENRYPVLVREFGLRRGSGGEGRYRGGDGLVRELEFLQPIQAAILSERRVFAPYGVQGGSAGQRGYNELINLAGQRISLGGKNMLSVQAGERVRIETPGGGGFGQDDSII